MHYRNSTILFKVTAFTLIVGISFSCKKRTNTSDTKVTGGKTLPSTTLPQVVFLGNCTGTFVSPRVIITAAHCITERPRLFGNSSGKPAILDDASFSVSSCGGFGVPRPAFSLTKTQSIKNHPTVDICGTNHSMGGTARINGITASIEVRQFPRFTGVAQGNDVALALMMPSKAVSYWSSLKPAKEKSLKLTPGKSIMMVVGYAMKNNYQRMSGYTTFSGYDKLSEPSILTLGKANPSESRAESGITPVDSGGPLFVMDPNNKNRTVAGLIGIASRSMAALGQDGFNYHADLANKVHMDWIESVMREWGEWEESMTEPKVEDNGSVY